MVDPRAETWTVHGLDELNTTGMTGVFFVHTSGLSFCIVICNWYGSAHVFLYFTYLREDLPHFVRVYQMSLLKKYTIKTRSSCNSMIGGKKRLLQSSQFVASSAKTVEKHSSATADSRTRLKVKRNLYCQWEKSLPVSFTGCRTVNSPGPSERQTWREQLESWKFTPRFYVEFFRFAASNFESVHQNTETVLKWRRCDLFIHSYYFILL